MNNINENERHLKSILKRKRSVTTATIVAFMIAGFVGVSSIARAENTTTKTDDHSIVVNIEKGEAKDNAVATDDSVAIGNAKASKNSIAIGTAQPNDDDNDYTTNANNNSIAVGSNIKNKDLKSEILVKKLEIKQSTNNVVKNKNITIGDTIFNDISSKESVSIGNSIYTIGANNIFIGKNISSYDVNRLNNNAWDVSKIKNEISIGNDINLTDPKYDDVDFENYFSKHKYYDAYHFPINIGNKIKNENRSIVLGTSAISIKSYDRIDFITLNKYELKYNYNNFVIPFMKNATKEINTKDNYENYMDNLNLKEKINNYYSKEHMAVKVDRKFKQLDDLISDKKNTINQIIIDMTDRENFPHHPIALNPELINDKTSINIGDATLTNGASVAVGTRATALINGVAIGENTKSVLQSVAIGKDSSAFSMKGISINGETYADYGVAMGGTVLGNKYKTVGLKAVSVDKAWYSRNSTFDYSVLKDRNMRYLDTGSIAIGRESLAEGTGGIALGAFTNTTSGVAIGVGSEAKDGGIAILGKSKPGSVVIGENADLPITIKEEKIKYPDNIFPDKMGLVSASKEDVDYGTYFLIRDTDRKKYYEDRFNMMRKTKGINVVSIGYLAGATKNGSVSLGAFSQDRYGAYDKIYDLYSNVTNEEEVNIAPDALGVLKPIDEKNILIPTLGTVSVGRYRKEDKIMTNGVLDKYRNTIEYYTRRIINVAGGYADTDAVNMYQLRKISPHYFSINLDKELEDKSKKETNKITNFKNDGAFHQGDIAIGQNAYTKIQSDNYLISEDTDTTKQYNITAIGTNTKVDTNRSYNNYKDDLEFDNVQNIIDEEEYLNKFKEGIKGAVAIGANSVADRLSGESLNQSGYDIMGLKLHNRTWKSTAGAVSIGGDGGDSYKSITRQIVNVAAGKQDTDAVNVAQLKRVKPYVQNEIEKNSKLIIVDKNTGKVPNSLKIKTRIFNLFEPGMTGQVFISKDNNNSIKLDLKISDINNKNNEDLISYVVHNKGDLSELSEELTDKFNEYIRFSDFKQEEIVKLLSKVKKTYYESLDITNSYKEISNEFKINNNGEEQTIKITTLPSYKEFKMEILNSDGTLVNGGGHGMDTDFIPLKALFGPGSAKITDENLEEGIKEIIYFETGLTEGKNTILDEKIVEFSKKVVSDFRKAEKEKSISRELGVSVINPVDKSTTTPITANNIKSNIGNDNKYESKGDDKHQVDQTVIEVATARTNVGKLNERKRDLNNAATVGDLQALSIAGVDFYGNSDEETNKIHTKLGEKLSIKGEEDAKKPSKFDSASNNIFVAKKSANDKEWLEVRLNRDLDNINSTQYVKVDEAKITPSIKIDGNTSKISFVNSNGEITGLSDININEDNKNTNAVNKKSVKDYVTAKVNEINKKIDNLPKGGGTSSTSSEFTITANTIDNALSADTNNTKIINGKTLNIKGADTLAWENSDKGANITTRVTDNGTITIALAKKIADINDMTLGKGKSGKDGKDGNLIIKSKDKNQEIVINGKDGLSIKGAKGNNGSDGKTVIGINGKDGISVNGKDGVNKLVTITKRDIGTNGIDGQSGVIKVSGKDGTIGIDGQDGISINGKNGTNKLVEITKTDDRDGKVAVNGKNGQNGVNIYSKVVKVENGADGSKGKDGVSGHIVLTGHNGQNGKEGKSITADIHLVNGANGVDGTDGNNGTNGMTRIVYNDKIGTIHTVATLDDGLKFTGNDINTKVTKKINETLSIVGEGKYPKPEGFKSASNNIFVARNNANNLEVRLNSNLANLTSIQLGVMNNKTYKERIKIDGDKNSITFANNKGIINGLAKITDIDNADNKNKAVTVDTLKSYVENKINDINKTISSKVDNNTITNLTKKVKDNTKNIANLTNNVTTNTTDITDLKNLKTKVTGNTTKIDEFNKTVNQVNNNVKTFKDTINQNIATAKTEITNQINNKADKSELDTLSKQVTTNTTNIQSNTTKINNVKNIVNTTNSNLKELKGTVDKGINISAGKDKTNIKLGDTLNVVGKDKQIVSKLEKENNSNKSRLTLSISNEFVGKGNKKEIVITPNDSKSTDLDNLKSATFIGENDNGLKVTGKDSKVAFNTDKNGNGLGQIKGLKELRGNEGRDVATNKGYVDDRFASQSKMISNNATRIENVKTEMYTVGSLSSAMSQLHPMGYDPKRPSQIMVGFGSYKNKQAVALGASHYFSENLLMTASASLSQGARTKSMVGLGFTYKFGKDEPRETLALSQLDKRRTKDLYLMQTKVYEVQGAYEQEKEKNLAQEKELIKQNKEIRSQKAEIENLKQELKELRELIKSKIKY